MIKKDSILVRLKGVTFHREEKEILNNVDLTIQKGKITAIMGPSGTGKTTLLQLIGGQLKPDQGDVYFEDQVVNRLSRTKLYKLRRKMGVLFQHSALFSHISVFDNVAFPLREHTHMPESMIRDLVLMKLEAVGLRGAKDLFPSQLSGGMARRVALARAIALDPTLILYDEPFTGQDPISMGVLVKLIRDIKDAMGLTSVIVSHDVMETASIADYIYVIAGGKIVGQGTPLELERDENPHVKQFMHGLPDGAVPFHYPAMDYHKDILESEVLS